MPLDDPAARFMARGLAIKQVSVCLPREQRRDRRLATGLPSVVVLDDKYRHAITLPFLVISTSSRTE